MPLVTATLTGRLGNLLFQFAHLRAYAEQNGYEICLPPWIGERVFTIPEAVRPDKYKPDFDLGENLRQHQDDLIYTRKQVREWFTFKPEVLGRLVWATNSSPVLNVREGKDYVGAKMVCISAKSYKDAFVQRFGNRQFQWEKDSNPTRDPYFIGDPWASGLNTTEVCLPSFYRLMTAPILFRANSTFAYWASVLGNGRTFSPVVDGMKTGVPEQYCDTFVEGNWPKMTEREGFSDLHLKP